MTTNITVLKFGSSVLHRESDLARAVHEIYRHWRDGRQVVAVVSAIGTTTDDLLQQAGRITDGPDHGSLAALLATGEAVSAALLGLAADRSGIPVKILSPAEAGLTTHGPVLDAAPVSLDTAKIKAYLAENVVIVSGFAGVDETGGPTLLGRGGSDLTALFIARELDARCVLVKDVDGLYESDPAESALRPRRYVSASWETAARKSNGLVQDKAVRFAAENGLEFQIAAIGKSERTRIGSLAEELAGHSLHTRVVKVALLGCGTVGGGVYQRLAALPEYFEVVGVADRNPHKAFASGIPADLIKTDPAEIIARDCDVVVELLGGAQTAGSYIAKALESGKNVVSANKALLSREAATFERLAFENNVRVLYGAAVGGAVPVIETSSKIAGLKKLTGIINGTCNFICDELAAGIPLLEAIQKAQSAGFAESDPTLDITGTDAAQKLALIIRKAFGVEIDPSQIECEGIEKLDSDSAVEAVSRGNKIRLVAEAELTSEGIKASVKPAELPLGHPLANISGAGNSILLETLCREAVTLNGKGAGRWPTAEAVVGDLFQLYRELTQASEDAKAIPAGAQFSQQEVRV